ncbi:MAG: hypothetical protein IJY09_11110 [Lachnospiraceae bacterium]|nr:hypothetical protein [Lachnospiraceae bacterium]
MEKNSIAVKIEKIRRAIEGGEYEAALELAKTIDTTKLKSAADLSVLAEAYYRNSDFETALLYFEQIYQRTQTRRILINLINLCLKLSMADMAETYLRDFIEMAPQDFYRHIFRYRIDKLRGEDLDVLIFDLELLKDENYMEDWAYELAKLYHKSGQQEKCVAECNDIILWFGSGVFVERARALRAYYLAGQSANLSEKEEALAQEVRRLVTAGRSAEEVQNFIEETTTEAGAQNGYTEEEYRNERYGKPVYEEEGKDIVWKTKEFGKVSEEVVELQNTMDLLQGMQVAQQIRMALGEDREFVVERAEEEPEKEITEEFFEEQTEGWGEETAAEEPEEAEQVYVIEEEMLPQQRVKLPEAEPEVETEPEEVAPEPVAAEVESAVIESEAEAENLPEMETMIAEQEPVTEPEVVAEPTKVAEEPVAEPEVETEPEEVAPEPVAAEAEPTVIESEAEEPSEPETAEMIADIEDGEAEYEYPEEVVLQYFPEEETVLARLLQERRLSLNHFFGGFLANVKVRKQLIHSLEQIFDLNNKNVSLLITGEEKSGKTALAKSIAKMIQALGALSSPRVAIIQAEKLNRISLQEKKAQLINTTMIIEKAGRMSTERVQELLAMKKEFAGATAVILEDTQDRMEQLLLNQTALAKEYDNLIHLPKWSAEDLYLHMLAQFVAAEYRIEKRVAARLREWVRELAQTSGVAAYGEVLSYAKAIINKAEARMAEELKQYAAEGRFAEADLMMIRMEDL